MTEETASIGINPDPPVTAGTPKLTVSQMVSQLEAQETDLLKTIASLTATEARTTKSLSDARKELRDTRRMLKAAKPAESKATK